MSNKDVIILGSGLSILDLSSEEINYINQCEVIIAINKFMAFYQKSQILPNHIYFVDAYDLSNVNFLQHIFNVCRKNKLEGLTFIISKTILEHPMTGQRFCSKRIAFILKKKYLEIENEIHNKLFHGEKANTNLFLIPENCKFELISHQHWLEGNIWGDSLQKPLFHYRGSLSTVLNYVSIKYPQRTIKLIGVDFNSPRYFFQDELEKLNFVWKDWTTSITQEKKTHFSAIPYQGTTIFDKFDFMLKNLDGTGNIVYSCNRDSLLIEKGLVKYSAVIS
ncbi:hypothetical protein [Aphanothece sacrum]|uniref:Uncharacterized protein n=1 Tax=Aphanothece sacrum FPU1 TaxID=1920663 RepID=A0A401II60_APHSA|nr:hypothetical protein [Aphanothece sacrum]GBF80944.1 hypothetical protein AsFPU1_2353 [Aphanothece sacrum FPU1]GBF85251.1 hypothetical protein AsFPU3_2310 [Aphanothece sacrum FPU3]